MTRLVIDLPDDLKARAEQQARAEGVSLSDLVRESLERRLTTTETPAASGERDPLFADDFVHTDESPAPTDVAANHDQHLVEVMEEEMRRWRKA